jgi:hypothetical protein
VCGKKCRGNSLIAPTFFVVSVQWSSENHYITEIL